MKVLQINCVYNVGSTGKIMYDIHTELQKKNIESVICYGRGDNTTDKNVYKTCGEFYSNVNHFFANLTGIMYGGCLLSTSKLISVIKKEKPDIVHLHCINGYFVNIYRLVSWLKKSGIKTVLTNHAEFMFTGGCGHALDCEQWRNGCKEAKCPQYNNEMGSWLFDRSATMWKRMYDAFRGFDKDKLTVVSVSPWLMNRAKSSDIFKNYYNTYVLNGLDTTAFHIKPKQDFEQIPKNKKIIFHVTPHFDNNSNNLKGGYYFIELARRFENNPNLHFVVAGTHEKLEDLPENLTLLGRIEGKDNLADLYSSAEVTVITSKRETFSMVTAESLCCGTPVVGFCAGGPESIALPEFCRFSEYGNIDMLEENLLSMLDCKQNEQEKISQLAKEKYDSSVMSKNYIKVYRGTLNV